MPVVLNGYGTITDITDRQLPPPPLPLPATTADATTITTHNAMDHCYTAATS
jgi:hypothetical protein